MKKILAVFGLMLIVSGSAFLFIYNLSDNKQIISYKEIINQLVDPETYTWKISWNEIVVEWDFSRGEEMIVAVWPHYDWGIPSLEPETGMFLPPNSTQWFEDVKRLRVNITNTDNGNFTLIEIYYVYLRTKLGTPLIFQDYFGVIDNTGALSLDGAYPKAGTIDGKGVIHLGKVKTSGAYRLTFSIEPTDVMDEKIVDSKTVPWPHPISPPDRVRLYKCRQEILHPYKSPLMLLIGTAIIIVGGIVIFKSRRPRKSHPKSTKIFKSRISSIKRTLKLRY